MEAIVPSAVEWGVAASALSGQPHSGDHHVVIPFLDGLLITVLDGVGHGEEAAVASRTASIILEKHAADPVIALVQRCLQAPLETRGVVMSVASFNIRHGLMTWLRVGTVGRILLRCGRDVASRE